MLLFKIICFMNLLLHTFFFYFEGDAHALKLFTTLIIKCIKAQHNWIEVGHPNDQVKQAVCTP